MNAISVPDPDLEISGVGRSSRPLDKGKWREGGWSPKFFFRPFGPQFGLKITEGGGGPLAGSAAAFPFSFPPEIG